MAVDPRNFLLNTDYEMDKLVLFKSGSLTAGTTSDVAHGLSFTPLVFGVCATNSNFSDARTIPFNQQTPSDQNTIAFDAYADSTNVHLAYTNYNSATSRMYYRIYAFEPSGSTADVPATSGSANQFILNTDYNYCKLYSKGTVNGNANTTITHNLGYVPQMMAWVETGGIIRPINDSDWFNHGVIGDPVGIQLTTSSITFKYAGAGFTKIHYRIYYDEA